jgi:hypothetical protein
MEEPDQKKRGHAASLRSCRLGLLVRCQWRCLDGWVRRLALEVGRGANMTIPGTKFPVSEAHVKLSSRTSDECSHVAALVFPRALFLSRVW